jgi:uncharacterized protein (DUF1501 family)
MVPKFLKAFESPFNFSLSQQNKSLVVVQLSGGNDGLNTIIPYRNDEYYKLRPHLGIKKQDALILNDDFALNPSLTGLRKLYDEGLLCVINGVGYPNPDHSHFRAMDIWHSASGSENLYNTGWIGRYLDANCSGICKAHYAVELDEQLSLALRGEKVNGFAVKNPDRLLRSVRDPYLNDVLKSHQHKDDDSNVEYLYKTMRETFSSAEYLQNKMQSKNNSIEYQDNEFAKNLKTLARLINSEAETKVYYISLSGFDTHVNQFNQQKKYLEIAGEGLYTFVSDLKQNSKLNDVCILVFSEFGRRVAQNASFGTDHGTANNVCIISNNLKIKGFYNPLPSLTDLNDGDLKYTIDFRNIYATLLKKQLGADDKLILKNTFEMMGFI